MSIFDRISSLAHTEWAHASNLAHETFQSRVGHHRHTGRALVETVATLCRDHPNLIGIAVGFLVERLLVQEKHHHDAELAARDGAGVAGESSPPWVRTEGAHAGKVGHTAHLKLGSLKPAKIGWEVFAGLVLLKLASSGARMFRHKHQHEVWFAPAARIRLFSGSIAAYQFAKALRSPRISASRNAMVMYFGTNALKPLLNPSRKALAAAARARASAGLTDARPPATPAPALTAAPIQAPPAHLPAATEPWGGWVH